MKNTTANYTKIKQLGHAHGGRSTWLAQDEQGQQVVLKEFIFGGTEAKWSELKAIGQEADTLAKLNHPQIPKLLDQYETEQGYSIVMEYIEGETLNYRIGFPIAEAQLIDIAKQCLEILAYIHGKGLLHRDIKPENIIVGSDNRVNLVDFGLSRNPNAIGSSTALMGTLGFAPPEQWRGVFKPASDLYALGVTLVCLATGTGTSDVVSIIGDDNSLRFDLHSQYGRDFDKWLHKLTATAMGDRYQTAGIALAGLVIQFTEPSKPMVMRPILAGLTIGTVIGCAISLFAATLAPQPLAHTPEYDALVAKHIDTNQIKRSDLDLAVTKEDLSPQFSVYRFRHSKLQGSSGYLTVLVNRSANDSTKALSIQDIDGKPPNVTIKGECLSIPQIREGIENQEVCFDSDLKASTQVEIAESEAKRARVDSGQQKRKSVTP